MIGEEIHKTWFTDESISKWMQAKKMNCHCITYSLRKNTEKTLREKLPTGQSFGYYKGWYTWNIESRQRLKLYTDSWASRNSLSVWSVSSVQLLSYVWLFVIPWSAALQASLSSTNSWSLLKLMSVELVMPSNHLILCHPCLPSPSILPSIRVFSNESALHVRWPK